MEAGYWQSNQRNNWEVFSGQEALGDSEKEAEESALLIFSNRVQLTSSIKNVMRKMAMIVVGVTLFVAGYQQIHRQNEYATAKATAPAPGYTPTSTSVPDNIKQTVAFRLVKAS